MLVFSGKGRDMEDDATEGDSLELAANLEPGAGPENCLFLASSPRLKGNGAGGLFSETKRFGSFLRTVLLLLITLLLVLVL
jgi:hypothetical protein